jgi:hypothetical protein
MAKRVEMRDGTLRFGPMLLVLASPQAQFEGKMTKHCLKKSS